mmetsp:Transcript_5731/g.16134  ORF Transcript_5731/g.16134 Transcript_5731/m.16134 type:complete len:232 (-) Transcript_5731:573-1268(-)
MRLGKRRYSSVLSAASVALTNTSKVASLPTGDVAEVEATCPTLATREKKRYDDDSLSVLFPSSSAPVLARSVSSTNKVSKYKRSSSRSDFVPTARLLMSIFFTWADTLAFVLLLLLFFALLSSIRRMASSNRAVRRASFLRLSTVFLIRSSAMELSSALFTEAASLPTSRSATAAIISETLGRYPSPTDSLFSSPVSCTILALSSTANLFVRLYSPISSSPVPSPTMSTIL